MRRVRSPRSGKEAATPNEEGGEKWEQKGKQLRHLDLNKIGIQRLFCSQGPKLPNVYSLSLLKKGHIDVSRYFTLGKGGGGGGHFIFPTGECSPRCDTYMMSPKSRDLLPSLVSPPDTVQFIITFIRSVQPPPLVRTSYRYYPQPHIHFCGEHYRIIFPSPYNALLSFPPPCSSPATTTSTNSSSHRRHLSAQQSPFTFLPLSLDHEATRRRRRTGKPRARTAAWISSVRLCELYLYHLPIRLPTIGMPACPPACVAEWRPLADTCV